MVRVNIEYWIRLVVQDRKRVEVCKVVVVHNQGLNLKNFYNMGFGVRWQILSEVGG